MRQRIDVLGRLMPLPAADDDGDASLGRLGAPNHSAGNPANVIGICHDESIDHLVREIDRVIEQTGHVCCSSAASRW